MGISSNNTHHRAILRRIAQRAMLDRGLLTEVPADAQAELGNILGPKTIDSEPVRDLRDLLWASIDNDDSRDLDQLSVAQTQPAPDARRDPGAGATKILVAIADVAATVRRGSAIDQHAAVNTTSVYTAAQVFPMLPERLSTDLTS